ncbi:Ku protein [Maritimibacter sp. UBA3975]|uniref:non-homologous end joining protein Ku n=1 Tax=Maritimibacter sp. UBA3975 TaxID=1946833 RepID=UPI000C0A8C63|nr:Ku protein [Maritimibacter sp. UBA3975]MAM62979.1 Ku protein [Maritimibacter sp.]|tara:strand:+ start:20701 stop:21531 length:831 start_codon:yes stop_codon:yes gene_type:complete
MASRAIWKGQLRLSLVSIPVEIHSARESGSRVSFRQIHGPSGKPVHYQKTVQGVGPVESDEIVKGYETDDGDYILLEPDEIDAIKLETKKTLELVQFVETSEIAPIWFDRPYYVVPSDELAEDAYRVVRDALRQTRKAGLGQLTMRGKEYLCAIRPCGDGLLMETLHYEKDIRNADPLFSSIADDATDDELLDVATQLIDKKTAPFDASAFEDHYAAALRDLIDRKMKSKKTPRAKRPDDDGRGEGENVVDLMDALKKSLKQSKGGKSGGRRKKAS